MKSRSISKKKRNNEGNNWRRYGIYIKCMALLRTPLKCREESTGLEARSVGKGLWGREMGIGQMVREKMLCYLCLGGDTHGMSWGVNGNKGRSGSKEFRGK